MEGGRDTVFVDRRYMSGTDMVDKLVGAARVEVRETQVVVRTLGGHREGLFR